MAKLSNPKGVQTIRGLPFPNLPEFIKEKIEATLDYMPHDGDIIIASYPKTGTTWLQYIVHQIVTSGEKPPSMNDLLHKKVPYMDFSGIEAIEALVEPRIYKHHLPYNVAQKNPNARYLYIYRNPGDTLVSYYHFMQDLMEETLDFNEFFRGFLTGNIGYGSYFEHVLSYISTVNSEKLLLISYEKLRSKRKEEILRIAKFIGDVYYQNIVKEEKILNRILEHTNFDYMKKNLPVMHAGKGNFKTINFFRKGSVGDGRKMLSPEQLKDMNELMAKMMKGTSILNEWQSQK